MGAGVRGVRTRVRPRHAARVLPHLLRRRLRRERADRRRRGGTRRRDPRADRGRPASALRTSRGTPRRDPCPPGPVRRGGATPRGFEDEPEAVPRQPSRCASPAASRGRRGAPRRDGWMRSDGTTCSPLRCSSSSSRPGSPRTVDEAAMPRTRWEPIAGSSGRERVEAAAALAGRVSRRPPERRTPSTSFSRRSTDLPRSGSGWRSRRLGSSLRALWPSSRQPAAIETARHARNELEALGASREADAAAALMRSLGAKGERVRGARLAQPPGGRGAAPPRRGALEP